MSPVQRDATVVSLRPVGAYQHLVLHVPDAVELVEPGHFIAVGVGGPNTSMLLRRAFSIHEASGDTVEVVFAPHGPGTQWLSRVHEGDTVNVIAPLGQPFALPREPMGAVLVAGGYGAAPMGMLARALRERGCAVSVVLGAASQDKLFGVLDLRRDADEVFVTTDDGSSGMRGRVTDALPAAIESVDARVVYACGPMPMLKAVAQVAGEHGVYSQTAVEESMACGIGICMTCVLPVVGDDGVTRMVRSCVDGPVFRGDQVRWDDVHTVPADTWGAGTH